MRDEDWATLVRSISPPPAVIRQLGHSHHIPLNQIRRRQAVEVYSSLGDLGVLFHTVNDAYYSQQYGVKDFLCDVLSNNNSLVERVYSFKFLGITIDDDLK